MIVYKINVLEELKRHGYSTYVLRKQRIFGEKTIQMFRDNEIVNITNLDKVCTLLDCNISDIIEFKK